MPSFGVLYIDAYDSFSNNIIALLAQSVTVTVIKVDEEVADLKSLLAKFAAVVVGPGPGHPENSQDIGLIPSILSAATEYNIPVLGICLGFQTLCSSGGASISRLPVPYHGRSKEILHVNADIFRNVGPVLATCYNSLGVLVNAIEFDSTLSRPGSAGSSDCNSTDTIHTSPAPSIFGPANLIPLAHDNEGYLMAVRHPSLPQWGLQFHPESCKSNLACRQILKNWWALVLSWNGQHRSMPASLLSTTEFMPKPSREDAMDGVFNHLLRLTEAVGPVLQSRRINSEISAEAISSLCNIPGTGNQVAMLQSTKKGRYSVYAIPSSSTFTIEHRGGVLRVHLHGAPDAQWTITARDCLDLVEHLVLHRKVTDSRKAVGDREAIVDDPSSPFWGGFLGYLSYELGLDLLDVNNPKPPSTPDLALLWADRSIIVDHIDHTTTVQSIRRDDDAWIKMITNKVAHIGPKLTLDPRHGIAFQEALRSSSYAPPNELEYKSRIATCLEHLRAGNSYELCLTTEAQIRLPASVHHAYQLYQNLRRCNPVPFAAYLAIGATTIVSSSPEQFLTWDRKGTIDMIPMKGTVRKTPSMTFARASSLLASAKEQAENLMIADLIRHDLHSALGPHANVRVEKLCAVEEHETVYQLVSHIRAEAPIPTPLSAAAAQDRAIQHGHRVLRHALPPGSMTGAPKKRSCAILSRLEKRARGVYSGVIGYFDIGGGGGWSVCIRSAFTTAGTDAEGMQTWRIGAGGAITVLSDPQAEWEEMQTKLQSVLRAFEPDENVA